MKTTLAKGERQENAHGRLFIEFRPNDLVDFRQHAESTVAPTAFSHENPLTLQLSHAFGVDPYW